MSRMLESALEYADRGWNVFPLKPDSKIPLTKSGHLEATTNLNQIEAWWTEQPSANIGLSLAASGLVAIDVDSYKTNCHWDAFRGEREFDPQFIQQSARGGHHYLFTASAEDQFSPNPCSGVDIKHNGYIVLAPSTFEGQPYVVKQDDEPMPVPDWLIGKNKLLDPSVSHLALGSHSRDPRSDNQIIKEILNGYWYTNMLILTARHVARGLRDEEIHSKTDQLTLKGFSISETRSDVQKMINGARRKGFEPVNNEDDSLSDDALALELGRLDFDENARFVSELGTWIFWNNLAWKPEKVKAYSRTRDFLRQKAALYPDHDRSLRSKTKVAAVEHLARSNPASAAAAEAFDSDIMLLGTPGGTVDLRTAKMRHAHREDMITMQTAIAPKSGTPKRFMQFLDEIEVCPDFLQRLAGYALTGSTKEEKFFFFYGSGANGKSKFVEQLQGIMGAYSRKSPISTFIDKRYADHPTELASLKGARLVTSSEIPPGKRWNEAIIKDLTGGDTISARLMRQDFFDFKPQLTLIIVGNTQPSLTSVDSAIRRRMVLVPFLANFERNADNQLEDKLHNEWPQILNWAIEGAVKWQLDGLKIPHEVLIASEAYLAEEDMIGQFIEEKLEKLSSNSGYFLSNSDLYVQFEFWCSQNGHQAWLPRNFNRALKERGFEEGRQSQARGFLDLRYK